MNLQVNFEDGSARHCRVEAGIVSMDETKHSLHVSVLSSGRYHILVNGQSLEVELVERLNGDAKRLKLKVGNKNQLVVVKSDTDIMLEKMGLGAKKSTILKEFKAPMPGLVVNILVQEGQILEAGEPILVLEAMKMENMLKAPDKVTIGKVLIEKGQKVEKNQIMISFS